MEQNYKIIIQYDGSRYDGWQKQKNTGHTIQGKLEDILEKLSGKPIEIHGSGRTDAGVHALMQVANFHMDTELPEEEILSCLNRFLPEDISVCSLEIVSHRFHSRLNAVEKVYRYQIEMSAKNNVFHRKYWYDLGQKLDIELMKQASSYLIGQHDFKSFCSNKKMKKSTVRRLKEIKFQTDGTRLVIEYRGNGFLYHMVRILTGTLIEVGMGKRNPLQMEEILAVRDRSIAGYTVPAKGLFLTEVIYEKME